MQETRSHRATSADGTELVGRVEGRGPPLVFVNAALGDADRNWTRLVPLLTERFTCFRMSTRGRGESADRPDHSPERLMEDIAAFAESVDRPVGLLAHSAMGALALGAAARTEAVSAVAVYETPSMAHPKAEIFQARVQSAAEEGGPDAVVRTVFDFVANDEERAVMLESGYVEARKRYVPVFLQEAAQGAYRPLDVSVLGRIQVPVLYVWGSRTPLADMVALAIQTFSEHLTDFQVTEILGAGHFGHQVEPQAVARELTEFFARDDRGALAP